MARQQNSKIQVSNSKEMQSIKAKEKKERKPVFILFLLEFDYSLEFGFWSLEFIELRAKSASG